MLAGAAPGACAVAVPPSAAVEVAEAAPPRVVPTAVEVAEVGPDVLVAEACALASPALLPAADVPGPAVFAELPVTPAPTVDPYFPPIGPAAALAFVLPVVPEAAADEPRLVPELALAPENPPSPVLAEAAAPTVVEPLVELALWPPDASELAELLPEAALDWALALPPIEVAPPSEMPPLGPAFVAPAPAELSPLPYAVPPAPVFPSPRLMPAVAGAPSELFP